MNEFDCRGWGGGSGGFEEEGLEEIGKAGGEAGETGHGSGVLWE